MATSYRTERCIFDPNLDHSDFGKKKLPLNAKIMDLSHHLDFSYTRIHINKRNATKGKLLGKKFRPLITSNTTGCILLGHVF